jgi:hypothetical protein
MALSLRRCLDRTAKRAQKLDAALAGGEPGDVVAAVCDDLAAEDLTPDELADPDVWRQLDPLERYRFAYIPGGRRVPLHDDDHQLCCIRHGLDPDWSHDDSGQSWRAGVDRAMAGDIGTDAADDW